MRTILLVALTCLTVIVVPAGTLGHTIPGHGGAVCDGSAPTTTACTTGEHLNTWSNQVELNFPDTAAYTGTLEARLTPEIGRVHVHNCDYNAGNLLGCTTTGPLPTPGVTYTHNCKSYDLNTTTPGGSGNWSCRIYHTVA